MKPTPILRSLFIVFMLTLTTVPVFGLENRVVIKGTVEPVVDKTITLKANDLFSEEPQRTGSIDEEGRFCIDYVQLYPHDNTLSYGDKLYQFIAAPGDTIQVTIHQGKITFSEAHADLNNELQSFRIRGDYDLAIMVLEAQQTLSPDDYKKRIRAIHQETDSLLEAYFTKHQSSLALRQWETNYYKYRMYDDLMRYSMFNPNTKLPDDYYNFLDEMNLFPVNPGTREVRRQSSDFDARAFMSSITNDVVEEYMVLLRKRTAAMYPEETKEIHRAYQLVTQTIVQETSGRMREIQLAYLFHQLAEWKKFDLIEDNIASFYAYVQDSALISYVLGAYKKTKQYLDTDYQEQYLTALSKDSLLAPLIDSIVSKNAGKVLYIDFWATWCAPCLNEMRCADILKEKLKGQDVAFVYLCVESEEADWKQKIKELNIRGDHYRLTADQYNLLSERFQIEGIPHYVLVDKRGKIIPHEAFTPCETASLDAIKELL